MSANTKLLPKQGKLLGIDVGRARIGLAVCDPLQLVARPLSTLERTSRRADFASLSDLVQREEVVAIVCGLPLNIDGSEGDQAKSIRKWAKRLAYALFAIRGTCPPILFWDESLSTIEAHELTPESAGRAGDDAEAAAVILQRYLDRSSETDTGYGFVQMPSQSDRTKGQSESAP